MSDSPFVFHTSWGPLAGRIHRPAAAVEPRGVVTVTGSWLTVKEQMPDRYARALADRGFVAVTYDFPGFGESGGDLRQAEIPAQKMAVIGEIARQVSTLGLAPGGQVGHLAVCASAQYAMGAAAQGAPIAALVSVAGWFHDPATVGALYGGDEGVADRIARGQRAASTYVADGEVEVVPAYKEGDEDAAMFIELEYYADPSRGAIPQWRNEMAVLSWEQWLQFDGLSAGADVVAPVLFVHSDDSVLPDNVRSLADRVPHATLRWAEGFQTDFYDLDPQVTLAADAAAEHFAAHLSGSAR